MEMVSMILVSGVVISDSGRIRLGGAVEFGKRSIALG